MAIFQTFLFSQFRPGKCLLRYSRTKKKPFYAIKTNSAKNRKIGIFGVQKWQFYRPFFLSNLERENVFYHILERKNSFLRYKNKKFKKSKNWHFSQGVNPWFFFEKWPFFQLFVFKQFRPGKCLLRYFRKKKRLSRL